MPSVAPSRVTVEPPPTVRLSGRVLSAAVVPMTPSAVKDGARGAVAQVSVSLAAPPAQLRCVESASRSLATMMAVGTVARKAPASS